MTAQLSRYLNTLHEHTSIWYDGSVSENPKTMTFKWLYVEGYERAATRFFLLLLRRWSLLLLLALYVSIRFENVRNAGRFRFKVLGSWQDHVALFSGPQSKIVPLEPNVESINVSYVFLSAASLWEKKEKKKKNKYINKIHTVYACCIFAMTRLDAQNMTSLSRPFLISCRGTKENTHTKK